MINSAKFHIKIKQMINFSLKTFYLYKPLNKNFLFLKTTDFVVTSIPYKPNLCKKFILACVSKTQNFYSSTVS